MALDVTLLLSALLVALVLLLVLAVRYHQERVGKLEEDLAWASSERRKLLQQRSSWGEHWAPLLSGYPYDPRNFRFLGAPVEGVQFEADRIVFVSLGIGPRVDAEKVRDLVRSGRVEYHEAFKAGIDDASPTPP